MQRHGNDPLENLHIPEGLCEVGHDSAQDFSDARFPLVLETVNRRQERPLITPHRAGDRIGSVHPEAVAAKAILPFRDGKRDPATGTKGGTEDSDPGPTGWTERERIMLLQRFIAGHATGRIDQVGDPGQDLFQG